MTGYLTAIFVSPSKHSEQISLESAQLIAGKGITGDRFYGNRQKHTQLNLTLIEAETIEAFNRCYNETLALSATRRNLITRNVRLNDLVDKHFYIGDVLCVGRELCEPCIVMARQISNCGLSSTDIIRFFENKGGLRAEILTSGIAQVGDYITAAGIS
ncbi:MAG: sulfurase [Methylococcaceae bacterium]|nr:sulfurase [Methylococcaceae bacterium]